MFRKYISNGDNAWCLGRGEVKRLDITLGPSAEDSEYHTKESEF